MNNRQLKIKKWRMALAVSALMAQTSFAMAANAPTDNNDFFNAVDIGSQLDALGGTDTVSFDSAYANFGIKRNTGDFQVTDLEGSLGTKTLMNVERLSFQDFTVNLTIQSTAENLDPEQIERLIQLYVAFFNRIPEADGLEYWMKELQAGKTLDEIAESFYRAGIQYSDLTGYSSEMSDEAFIHIVYKNILSRAEGADEDGLAFWKEELRSGRASRASLVATIVDAAYGYEGDPQWGWVLEALDYKLTFARRFAIEFGLNYANPEESISKGMQMSGAINADGYNEAYGILGMNLDEEEPFAYEPDEEPLDTEAPVITLLGDKEMTIEVGDEFVDPGTRATDNVDPGVLVFTYGSVDTQTPGVYTLTYKAEDSAGNKAVKNRTVTVIDTVVPVITLNGDASVELVLGEAYTDAGATANDNVDGDITANIIVGGDLVNTASVGSYTLTYNVSDSSGNSAAEVTRTVEVVAPLVANRPPLNDTGITWGGNYPSGNNTNCTGETIGEQDCSHGRDKQAMDGYLAKVGAGLAGFDFTKLAADGTPLAVQDQPYSEAGSEAAGTKWSCVIDNHTGLMWEVKSNTSQGTSLHSAHDEFTWYNSDSRSNGGANGEQNTAGTTCYGYNDASYPYCNIEAFVNRVNTEGLCGYNDWRVPNLNELQSIAYFGELYSGIDLDYFPNALLQHFNYWSSSPFARDVDKAWAGEFADGYDYERDRSDLISVRLVRELND